MSESYKPITSIAELNPSVSISGFPDDYVVSFIGIVDVLESGRLLNRHDRYLRDWRTPSFRINCPEGSSYCPLGRGTRGKISGTAPSRNSRGLSPMW